MKIFTVILLTVGYYHLLALIVFILFYNVISYDQITHSSNFVLFGGFMSIALAIATLFELLRNNKN